MLVADRVIAIAIMALSAYFMWHAIELPIGWNGMTGGPGGGAFPFWLSLVMLLAAGGILLRSLRQEPNGQSFFDGVMLRSVISVVIALFATIALIPVAGAYVAIPLFMFWYIRIFGRHSWFLTACLAIGTPVFLFFFFEVTLKILLPKGFTEPMFFPLYAMFF